MSFALWMVLAAILLPYVTIMPAKVTSRIDNHAPRLAMERMTGWQQRLDWAHRNHFETFPAFAAAVIIAQMRGAPQGWADILAGLFVLIRLAYTAAYAADRPSLRSNLWSLGFLCVLGLFALAATAGPAAAPAG
ncbi:MAPEG family protein [Inquilinus limosus]|uniref:Membrane protein n=1 Tax=Inquilinus limosus MP06 TaxID=1398085 RepID=A0A0A0CZ48_9PROT|nr:MAPEG family protein [Inquilinus limosus]KGM30818.1 membrane protein [Inquilinus limosus MP06]